MKTSKPILKFSCFPVKGKYWFSKTGWDEKRKGGFHRAVDIFGIRHNEIVYPVAGEIVEITHAEDDPDFKGGNSVTIKIKGTDIFCYMCHLEEVFGALGVQVEADNLAGTMGNSGNAKNTKPHCHLQCYRLYGGEKKSFINPTRELLRLADPKLKSKIGQS